VGKEMARSTSHTSAFKTFLPLGNQIAISDQQLEDSTIYFPR
jgi:hypothetical protein